MSGVDSTAEIAPWQVGEIELTAHSEHDKPYADVDVWADLTHDDGTVLRRPAFWDGDATWRIRFSSPLTSGTWQWRTDASVDDIGLQGTTGAFEVTELRAAHRFHQHGFWRMSAGGRSLVHADGTPAVLVGDTAWALPFRATEDDVRVYAADRSEKGFNAALLMSVQPDMHAVGPRDRTADEGFDVGFDDLPQGHLTQLNVDYFRRLDGLLDVLVDHAIVPVLNPVFHGFGWKGLDVAGTVVPAGEYARYCRYLVARYGAAPVIYLVGADGWGTEPQIAAGGEEIQAWDCYRQPTGIHYNSSADNRAFQQADWLDFQWCQTGHFGVHAPERVADMWRNTPPKAVANGEPSYERTASEEMAADWWQGHEAWSNLCAGGTMGVVYGAADLWQWKLHADEPGHSPYFLSPGGSWREALDLPGATLVGLVGKILDGLPTTDMAPDWSSFISTRGLHVPGRLQLTYEQGPGLLIPMKEDGLPVHYRIIDLQTGKTLAEGDRTPGVPVPDGHDQPRLIIFCDEPPTGGR